MCNEKFSPVFLLYSWKREGNYVTSRLVFFPLLFASLNDSQKSLRRDENVLFYQKFLYFLLNFHCLQEGTHRQHEEYKNLHNIFIIE